MRIIGAGLAGLIAANMLSRYEPVVFERSNVVPNNHNAVLRFRSNAVAEAVNIPFKRVTVIKDCHGGRGVIDRALMYAFKVTGKLQPRSVLSLTPVDRFIAPVNMVKLLSRGVNFNFGQEVEDLRGSLESPTISTIPIHKAAELLKYDEELPKPAMVSGWNIRMRVLPEFSADFYATIYDVTDAPYYRISITEDEIFIEGINAAPKDEYCLSYALDAASLLGITEGMIDTQTMTIHHSSYQKISEPNHMGREQIKRFILWASKEHDFYSLGRFATWRSKLLLDDIPNDVRMIQRLIDGATPYSL